jgi:hypothetical protein
MTTLTALEVPVHPINPAAVVDAALRAINSVYGSGEMGFLALDLAKVIRENQEAKEELEELLELGSEDEGGRHAFGVGMVAGMMYAQLTGMKIPVPERPELEAQAAPDAPEGA